MRAALAERIVCRSLGLTSFGDKHLRGFSTSWMVCGDCQGSGATDLSGGAATLLPGYSSVLTSPSLEDWGHHHAAATASWVLYHRKRKEGGQRR